MRRAAKVDQTQTEVVNALRACGMTVALTSAVGKGFPDAVVGFRGGNFLLEFKSRKAVSHRGLNPLTVEQQKFHESWAGQITIVETPEEAVKAVIEHAKLMDLI